MAKVVMYTLSTCPWCRKTKQFFTEKNIPFECTDYDLADEKEKQQIREEMSKYGSVAFPFVKINGEVVIGWNPQKYAEFLRL